VGELNNFANKNCAANLQGVLELGYSKKESPFLGDSFSVSIRKLNSSVFNGKTIFNHKGHEGH
jgi:hypothetical protein